MKQSCWFVVVTVLLLAACNPAPDTSLEPTPELTAEVTATRFVLTRAPLPPTWTPYVAPTATRTLTITPPPFTAMPTFTLPANCFEFRAEYERMEETFILGTAPTLYWTPIEDASEYRVVITDPEGEAVLVRWVDSDVGSFTVPAETFVLDEDAIDLAVIVVYGWEVTPVDETRTGYCDTIGGELIPVLDESPPGSDDGGDSGGG